MMKLQKTLCLPSLIVFFLLFIFQQNVFAQATYKKEWKQVDSLLEKGLSQSALKTVELVYKQAKQNNNTAQIVKACIYKIKLIEYKEEDALQKSIALIKEEANKTSLPLKPILHSMLAELYWNYYENNRWKIQDRTQVLNFVQDDISTWTIKDIVVGVTKQYRVSLQDAESLKKIKIDLYDEVLAKEAYSEKEKKYSARKLRPTLYDFLAHRALDFYINEEPDLIQPANSFRLDSKHFFESYEVFTTINLNALAQKEDSLNLKFSALLLLQDLLRFRSVLPEGKEKTVSVEALIDVDLKRLRFVKNQSANSLAKDSLYMLALKNIEQKFSSYPGAAEVAFEIAREHNNSGFTYEPLASDNHKWDKKTALAICEQAIAKFPGSFGAENCKALSDEIKAKSLVFNIEEVSLPDKPFRTRVEYKNTNKLFVRIIENKNIKREDDNRDEEKLIGFYLKEKIIKEWDVTLPDDGDYQTHAAEIKIPALPLGSYIILIGSDSKFSYQKNAIAYSSFTISELSLIKRRTTQGGYDVLVLHRETGKPLKGVQAQLWTNKYNSKSRKYENEKGASYLTDENGSFSIPPIGTEDYNTNYFVELSFNNDTFFSDERVYMYKRQSQEKRFHTRTFFFTDRAIYRPGQAIFFKGLMIETDGETSQLLTNKNTTIQLMGVNGENVAKLNLSTNEYGSFSGTFTIPQQGLTGEMRIENENGSANFSVEEYKRPKFEVQFSPMKGMYKLKENISVKGNAKSYAGANISQAQVKYRVVRSTDYPFYSWAWRQPPSPQVEISSGITTSNDTGGFSIAFNALPDPRIDKKNSPHFSYTVYADVTDITGETHSNETNVRVGYNALVINVDMNEKILKDSAKTFNITSANLNGAFEPSHVLVNIWKQKKPARLLRSRLWNQADKQTLTKEEYYAAFLNDIYADEDKQEKWEKEARVFSQEIDTKENKNELDLSTMSQWVSGTYLIEITCKDKFGEDVKYEKYFTVFSPTEKTTPLNQYDWFTELKTKAEPGEKASFIIGTSDKELSVLYEIEHQNKIIKKEWITLSNEQKKIEIPIEEKYRGGLAAHIVFVKNNRVYEHTINIAVPFSNKDLKVEYESFRNKLLPGQKEEWKIKITDNKGGKATAELLASMYDASLDAFVPHDWDFSIYPMYYPFVKWETYRFINDKQSWLLAKDWNTHYSAPVKIYDQLEWSRMSSYIVGESAYDMVLVSEDSEGSQQNIVSMLAGKTAGVMVKENKAPLAPFSGEGKAEEKKSSAASPAVTPRKNLNETAFFFPTLQTDENGSIIIKFTAPEALTRWNFMGLVHTKDLKYTQFKKEIVTQKELMVTPHAPRFFREGDNITFTAKVDNLSSAVMNGIAQLTFFDAITMKEITARVLSDSKKSAQPFSAPSKQASSFSWDLKIPENTEAILCRVTANASSFSDGEEFIIPVLSNRMLVTESLPLVVRSKQTKTFQFEKLIFQNNHSTTLRNHKLTLEFCANPAWYAVLSLPYLMEYPYECAEQLFSRFYANSLATHIANSSPKIKAVFDAWKQSSPSAFYSNLEKNEELKSLFLNETPWVMEAKDEAERKKRVGLLFDINNMANGLAAALTKLSAMQYSNGGWPWFNGMPEDLYITQHIVAGMGHLDRLEIKNIRSDANTWSMIKKAISYIDDRLNEDYELVLKTDKKNLDKDHLSQTEIQYLYARSFFKDVEVSRKNQTAFNYYKTQAQKYWTGKGRYMQGMIALALYRTGDKKTPAVIMQSLKENALRSEEMGMYWKENYEGYYWYEAPIESQALMIEAFDEIAKDKQAVDELRIWLLRSKQTQNWKSTKATTEAVYALLLRGTDWLMSSGSIQKGESGQGSTAISLGGIKINPDSLGDDKGNSPEAGTGHFKKSWSGSDIRPKMGNITVSKKDEGISWGALYWQYFEQLDKIIPHATPLQLTRKLFIEKNTEAGTVLEVLNDTNALKPGDKIKVRIELRVDRSMEYVHLKDMRASGFEPINVLSQYKWQDGLGYYESTRDASTNFFIGYLPKGTYVFEYPLRVSHSGNFSFGISSIQCMYASEFSSHSEGVRVKVGR